MTTKPASPTKNAEREERLEIYKMLVEMADRVSQRRQAANNFYLSVNTALVGGSAYLKTKGLGTPTFLIVVLAGLMICLLWYQNIQSYKTLNDAKFKVINDVETRLVEQPFHAEWRVLDPDDDGERHKPFHKVERVVPWIFGIVYAGQALSVIPWSKIPWSKLSLCG
ncbi:RipA family octameric membrane protein [Sphingopyxis fribergensis]